MGSPHPALPFPAQTFSGFKSAYLHRLSERDIKSGRIDVAVRLFSFRPKGVTGIPGCEDKGMFVVVV